MNVQKKPRDWIGERVFRIEGLLPYGAHFAEYEIMEAPGDHHYRTDASCWLIGKKIKNGRPEYVDIPLNLLHGDSIDSFFPSKTKALELLETKHNEMLDCLRGEVGKVRCRVQMYDPAVTEPPYNFIKLDEFECDDIDEFNSSSFWSSLRNNCRHMGYKFRFYSKSNHPDYRYDVIVHDPS